MRSKLALIIVAANCALALVMGVCIFAFVSLGEMARGSREPAQPGSISIKFDKKTLKDRDQTMKKLDSMKENLFKMKNDDPRQYVSLPEREFVNSLFAYFFMSRVLAAKGTILDDAQVKDMREKGTLLYSMDRKYPFMKKSIYLDRGHKTANKPVIRPGTNIIIVFVESLSAVFLNEDVHHLKGLTPNINEFGRESFAFTDMVNSSFPTIKGLIASLGSAIYLLDENIGGTRIPIPCRFLFLSQIMKSMNYSTNHIQAGSERFIGMKDFFMEREGYDTFHGSESIALDNISSLRRGFGVDDDVLFDFTIDWLRKYPGNKPLFLTIQTINSHPPFKVKDRLPAAGDNDMVNALYSTDKAFGKFWDYFMKSKYANNTIVILTADHAMGNNKEYIQFMKQFDEKYYRPFFDVIPCFIRFPDGSWKGKVNDTPCVSLDITPTLLDMMNIDLVNPFMGLSIFSERQYYKRQKLQEISFKNLDEKKFADAKKMLGFYMSLYREDRILPRDYTVKLY